MKPLWIIVGLAGVGGAYLLLRRRANAAQLQSQIGDDETAPAPSGTKGEGGDVATPYEVGIRQLGGALPLPSGARSKADTRADYDLRQLGSLALPAGATYPTKTGPPPPPRVGTATLLLGVSTPAGDARKIDNVDPVMGKRLAPALMARLGF